MMIDFWYEFASTYSFLAAERIEALAEARGIRLRWRPFLLGPLLKAQGYSDTPFNLYPDKGRYMWRDMERWTARLGLPLHRPTPFPQHGLLAARIALALPDEARPAFTKAVFKRQFCAGESISDEAVLAEIVRTIGADFEPVLTTVHTPLVKDALKRQTQEAERLGIFGAPMLITSDGEMFWGNDRLEEALDWERGIR
jgi:2-hydroxychromene-2-carboxylate isomerase